MQADSNGVKTLAFEGNKVDVSKVLEVETNKENNSSTNTSSRIISDRVEVSVSPIQGVDHLRNLLYKFGNDNKERNEKIRKPVKHMSKGYREHIIKQEKQLNQKNASIEIDNKAVDQNKRSSTDSHAHRNKLGVDIPMNKVTEMKNFLIEFEKSHQKKDISVYASASKQRAQIEARMNQVSDLKNWLSKMESRNESSSRVSQMQKRSVNIPLNKVKDMQNWLLEFERQNKEREIKHKGKVYDFHFSAEKRQKKDTSNLITGSETYKRNDDEPPVVMTSPINSVSHLKNWLIDFEKKNKEHYEKHQFRKKPAGNTPKPNRRQIKEESTESSENESNEAHQETSFFDFEKQMEKSNQTEAVTNEEIDEIIDDKMDDEKSDTITDDEKSGMSNDDEKSRSSNDDDNASLKQYLDDLDDALNESLMVENTVNDDETRDPNESELEQSQVESQQRDRQSYDTSQTNSTSLVGEVILQSRQEPIDSSPAVGDVEIINEETSSSEDATSVDDVKQKDITPQPSQTSKSKKSKKPKEKRLKSMRKKLIHSAKRSLMSRKSNATDSSVAPSIPKNVTCSEPADNVSLCFSPDSNRKTYYVHPDADKRQPLVLHQVRERLESSHSAAALFEGMLSPDNSFDGALVETSRSPYKKSSKNVSEHVGWLKNVYSSPIGSSFSRKKAQRSIILMRQYED